MATDAHLCFCAAAVAVAPRAVHDSAVTFFASPRPTKRVWEEDVASVHGYTGAR